MIHDLFRLLARSRNADPGAAAGLTPRYAGLSDVGRVRSNNEDRWFADAELGLYLVADGMGGQLAGELASRLVVEVLPRQLRQVIGSVHDFTHVLTIERVRQAVASLSREIHRESAGRPGLSGMGATLVLALIRGAGVLVVHMGDSRAYLWHAGNLQCLTRDHTMVQALLDARAITAEEAEQHPARHQLTRFVGMPGEPLPEARLLDLVPGNRLLLCTDGLSSMLSDLQLRTVLGGLLDPQTACEQLVNAANLAGGQDNVTALLIAL